VTTSEAVQAAALSRLQRGAIPARQARIVCHWQGEGSWDALVPCTVVRLDAPSAFGTGFDGPVSIAGVQPSEETGACEVAVWFGLG